MRAQIGWEDADARIRVDTPQIGPKSRILPARYFLAAKLFAFPRNTTQGQVMRYLPKDGYLPLCQSADLNATILQGGVPESRLLTRRVNE